MPGLLVIGRAEIPTTLLGEKAFINNKDAFDLAFTKGINWAIESIHPLHGALYGGHLQLAKQILKKGSPITEETYSIALHYCPDFTEFLPPNPKLVSKYTSKDNQTKFNWALLKGDLTQAKSLLATGVSLNEPMLLTHGMGLLSPIHYAIRSRNLEVIKLLVEAGADINALNNEGKSPLRLLAEDPALSRKDRGKGVRLLQSRGGVFIPKIKTSREKFLLYFGFALSK